MALALDFSLRLEDRSAQRVLVSALLAPTDGSVRLEGVALQVLDKSGEPLGVRMFLPIAGELHHPMLSTVELKCADLPAGARVVGTAWNGVDVAEATLPTEPYTHLQQHVRPCRTLGAFAPADELEVVEGDERRRLAALYPWIELPRVPRTAAELAIVDDDERVVEDLVDGLGLDEESAEWLKDLLSEE
jgi:hypothetical protein